jgi:hypothetical protein
MVITLLLAGFITGWVTKPSQTVKDSFTVKIHDTLKTASVRYKILPGTDYNIDSLITVINQFWKDSLKNMYGKGLFESRFTKSDDLGTRTYTYTSRIPPDPESSLIIDEELKYPKRTFGLLIGADTRLQRSIGLKYYMIDSKHISLSGIFSGDYLVDKKSWSPNAKVELEILY